MKYSIQNLNLSIHGFQRFADSPRNAEMRPQAHHANDSAANFALCVQSNGAESGKNIDT